MGSLLFGFYWSVVRGGEKHSEEQQHRYQQVRSINGDQQPAFLQGLGSRMGFQRERIEEDVSEDRDKCGGDVCGVNYGGSPDPLTATFEESICCDGKERQLKQSLAENEGPEPLRRIQDHGVSELLSVPLQEIFQRLRIHMFR